MTKLLDYYNNELSSLRKDATRFAKDHPNVGAQLGIREHIIDDPYAERIVESLAYLSAKNKYYFDSQHDCSIRKLIEQVCPHYLLDIPALSIAKFSPENNSRGVIPRGEEVSMLLGDTLVKFSTVYDVDLAPIKLSDISIHTPLKDNSANIVKFKLEVTDDAINSLSDIQLNSLPIYINTSPIHSHAIYQLLMSSSLDVAIKNTNEKITYDSYSAKLTQKGFIPSESILPQTVNQGNGFYLLKEFFAYHQKFMFFEIPNLSDVLSNIEDNACIVELKISGSLDKLNDIINNDTFQLFCSPLVNLSQVDAFPFDISSFSHEHPILLDQLNNESKVIHSIKQVDAYVNHEPIPCNPYFGAKFQDSHNNLSLYWQVGDEYSSNSNAYTIKVTPKATPKIINSSRDSILLSPKVYVSDSIFSNDLSSHSPVNIHLASEAFKDLASVELLTDIKSPGKYYNQDSLDRAVYLMSTFSRVGVFDNSRSLDLLKDVLDLHAGADSVNKHLVESVFNGMDANKTTLKVIDNSKLSIVPGFNCNIYINDHECPHGEYFLFSSILASFILANKPHNLSLSINIIAQNEPLTNWQY